MSIVVTGSIAFDYLMSFRRFTEHLLPEHVQRVSLSSSWTPWTSAAAARAEHRLHAGAAEEWPLADGHAGADSETPAMARGRQRRHVTLVADVPGKFTASFFCSTDLENNQIASFYTGAMANAAELSFRSAGRVDLTIISPNDPTAMLQYADECRTLEIPFIFDPGQQCARMSGDELAQGLEAAAVLILNDYELELLKQKTEVDEATLVARTGMLVVTRVRTARR
jgi:adenosine kinase